MEKLVEILEKIKIGTLSVELAIILNIEIILCYKYVKIFVIVDDSYSGKLDIKTNHQMSVMLIFLLLLTFILII